MSRGRAALLAVVALALPLAFCWPIFAHPGWGGVEDWDVHFFYSGVERLSVLRYGQLPLWDPYYCGGMPLLGHPESRVLSPLFALTLALGVPLAAKVIVWLRLCAALAGTFLAARRAGLSREGSALAGCVFAFSGLFAVNLATGDFFGPAAYAPLALYFALDGFSSALDVLGEAVVLALTFCEGGAVIAPLLACIAGAVAAGVAAARRDARPLARLLAAGALAAALAAVKLVPALELMRTYPRPGDDYSGLSATGFAAGLLDADQRRVRDPNVRGFWKGASWGYDENGMYVGGASLALAAAGLVTSWRRLPGPAAALAASAWLALGDRARPSLWAGLRSLPLLSSLRVASRFRLGVVLTLALFAGAGLDRLLRLAPPSRDRARAAAAAAALGLCLLQLWRASRPLWAQAFVVPPPAARPETAFVQTALDPRNSTGRLLIPYIRSGSATAAGDSAFTAEYRALLEGRGLVDCDSQLPVPQAAAPEGSARYRGEAYVDGAEGAASYELWTPNSLRLRYRAAGPGWLVVNQNFAPQWRAATPAGEARPEDRAGLLAVAVPAGEGLVTLDYRPLSAAVGAAVSAATLLGLAAWSLRRGARR